MPPLRLVSYSRTQRFTAHFSPRTTGSPACPRDYCWHSLEERNPDASNDRGAYVPRGRVRARAIPPAPLSAPLLIVKSVFDAVVEEQHPPLPRGHRQPLPLGVTPKPSRELRLAALIRLL